MDDVITLPLSDDLRRPLSEAAGFFSARGVTVYATGGFLRDALVGAPFRDVDLSIGSDPIEIGPPLADALGGSYFALDEDRGHVRIGLKDGGIHVDLLPLRGAIEHDLKLRDYTVDALAAPLGELVTGTASVVDPTGGLDDLRGRLIRVVSEGAFSTDPLRLMRGVRLATQLDFEIESETAELIERHAALLRGAAVERQREELMRIMATPRAARGLRLLDTLGLMDVVLPEMAVTRGVEQPKEHHWDVLGHSFAAVESLDALLADGAPDSEPEASLWAELWRQLGWWSGARGHFREEIVSGTTRIAVLKLTSFLHDIGKPETKSFQDDGRMRFFGHSKSGAEIAQRLMRRLRFSAREIALAHAMIEAHLRPVQMAQQTTPSPKAIYRFFRDTGEAGIDTLFLSLADHLGTVGPRVSPVDFRAHVALVSYLLARHFERPAEGAPERLLDGDDLMAALGLAPGPQLGELLEVVREAYAIGEVTSRDAALELARRLLDAPKA